MKKIGILGGTSYPSTILYYQILNKLYNQNFGGFHSCPILLYSIDYHDIKSNYINGWELIPQLLKAELETLLKCNPSCVIIANNTLHKAFDIIKDEMNTDIPILHIVELTKQYILEKGYKDILLLGTKFTMEDNFFKTPLINCGINVITPNEEEKNKIQEIQSQLALGNLESEYIQYFEELNKKYSYLDAFILGCTEIPIIYQNINTEMNIINTLELQCKKAIEIFI